MGKEAPGKLFGTNTRPVEAEYNLVDTKTITKPHNVPIALEAFRPISEPAAIESVEAVMSIRDIVSSRAFKATPRVAYGATGPQTMSREAFEKVKEYMNANAQDFNLYGSLVGKAYLGEGGRVSLADVDALINTKGKTAPREHAENIFKLMMETDYPNAKITRVEFKNNTGEMDYLLQGEIGGKPFIQMKVEKSVLTGTRYSGRYTADIGTMKKGQLALDLHPHRLGSGGEWIEIPGISARTMGYSSIVWGKGTMGYGKLVLPKEGKATIGFDRIKDVVDLSDFARDAASRLYEPVRPGRWSMERTRMAMSAERASETFTRDVYALDVEGEGANLMAESQNPLAFGEGRINKHGALAAYQASMERIARKGLGEEAVLFPNEKNGIPQGKAIVEPHELDFIRKAEDIKSREYIEVFNKKNLLLGSNIGSRGSVSYPENIPEKQLIGSTTIHSHPSYWALDQLGAVLRGITKPYEPLLISQKTTMSFSDADILGQYNTGEKIGMVYSIPKKTIQLFEYPKRGLSEANIEFAQDRSETYAAIKIVEEVNEAKLKYREEASKTNIIGAARLYLGFRTRTGPEIDARFFQNKLTEYARLTKSKYYQLSNIDMETGLADVEVFNEPDTAMYSIANSRFKPGELAYDISPYTVGSSAFVGATKASLFSYPAKVESNYRVPSGSKYSLSSDYSIKNVGGSVYAASQPSEYSQRGYTVSDYGGYKPSGYTPSNYVGYAPKGYAPSNYGGYKPSGYGLKPTGYSQKGYGQKAYGTIVTPRAYGSVVSSKPYGSALPVTTTYGLSTRTYQGEYTIPTQKALPPTRAVPKSPLWSPRSPVSPIIFPPTVPSFPWALNEQERKVKRRRRRGVLVSQWLIKNPVPRISTVYGPYKWRYNVDTPAFGRRFSGSKVIVQSFPGDTTWLKKRGI